MFQSHGSRGVGDPTEFVVIFVNVFLATSPREGFFSVGSGSN